MGFTIFILCFLPALFLILLLGSVKITTGGGSIEYYDNNKEEMIELLEWIKYEDPDKSSEEVVDSFIKRK